MNESLVLCGWVARHWWVGRGRGRGQGAVRRGRMAESIGWAAPESPPNRVPTLIITRTTRHGNF